MPNIKYIARVLTGVRWKKLSHMLDVVHDKCGQSRVHTFFDILWCAARYGAGYYDYVMYGFYDLNGKQRDTYLTRVRNRKVFELMNDPAYNDDFDDKLRFNETFRAYLHRKTLNGETATEQQMADFVAGQEYIFAKINHGDSGRGVERLRVADFESPAAMLAYVRRRRWWCWSTSSSSTRTWHVSIPAALTPCASSPTTSTDTSPSPTSS